MPISATSKFSRVFGDDAVLFRLERLGKNPRIFGNLIQAGFPENQLSEARNWYIRDAVTPVEHYAGRQMARGFFEDESLLNLLCRFYECTDWKLEQSTWFFSKEDYRRFFDEITGPLEYHVEWLEQGSGEERWGKYFLKLPFDLGMDACKRSLWKEICQRDFYWKALADYTHLRAENLFQYLQRSVDIARFSPDQSTYNWERAFRLKFHVPLKKFEESLERAARIWQEQRKEQTTHRFEYGDFKFGNAWEERELMKAANYLGLDLATVNRKNLGQAFRSRSKRAHPDQGGTTEEFRLLSRYKELVASWLERRRGVKAT